jgi:ribonuclease HII
MRSPTFSFERALIKQGHQFIAGVDEVGCGAWAGPVYAAAVILSPGKKLPGARDSKTLSHEQRERLSTTIKKVCLSWAIGVCSVEEIAALNIRGASLLATQRALAGLSVPPDWILSDAFPVPGVTPCTPIVRGDALSKSIAAASIIAKVARDTFMTELDSIIPGYHFAAHKGYGTKEHQRALAELGPSTIHRASYAPIQKLICLTQR